MKKLLSLLTILVMVSGCTSILNKESFVLSSGQQIDYIFGKVSGDGQEANFRDAFIDGKPVVSNYGSGQSLWGQVLQGTVSSAMIAGGMVGGAALLRPDKINQQDSTTINQESQQTSPDVAGLVATLSNEEPIIPDPVVINNTVTATGGKSSSLSKSDSKSSSKATSKATAKQQQLQNQSSINKNSTSVKVKQPSDSCQHHCQSEQGPGDNNKKGHKY